MQPPIVLAHASWALIVSGVAAMLASLATFARSVPLPRRRCERGVDNLRAHGETPWRRIGPERYAATFLYRHHPLTVVLSRHSEDSGPCIWLLRYGPQSAGMGRDLMVVTRSIFLAHVGEHHETAQRVAAYLISTAGGTFGG